MDIKQTILNITYFRKGFFKNSVRKTCLAVLILLIVPVGTLFCDETDLIYKKCTSQKDTPGPWCYLEEVKKIGDPALCENILKYWPKARGVHGQCYYELAIKKKDCEICKRIKAKDIKRMYELDACK